MAGVSVVAAKRDPADDAAAGVAPLPTLHDILNAQARRNAGAPAILAPGRAALSFAALIARLDEVRIALNSRGLGRGDRVAILAERGADVAVMELGIASCAVCVPLHAAAAAAELVDSLVQTKAKALL